MSEVVEVGDVHLTEEELLDLTDEEVFAYGTKLMLQAGVMKEHVRVMKEHVSNLSKSLVGRDDVYESCKTLHQSLVMCIDRCRKIKQTIRICNGCNNAFDFIGDERYICDLCCDKYHVEGPWEMRQYKSICKRVNKYIE